MEKMMGDVTTKKVIGLCHILPKNYRSYQSLYQHLVIPFFLKTNISCYIHHYESCHGFSYKLFSVRIIL